MILPVLRGALRTEKERKRIVYSTKREFYLDLIGKFANPTTDFEFFLRSLRSDGGIPLGLAILQRVMLTADVTGGLSLLIFLRKNESN